MLYFFSNHKKGCFWVSAGGDDLNLLNKDNASTHVKQNGVQTGSTGNNRVSCMYKDKNRNFRIGIHKGLNLFNRENSSFYLLKTRARGGKAYYANENLVCVAMWFADYT